MRQAFVLGFAAILLMASATTADARRGGGGGWYEDLKFVADTQYPGLSLCHLVKHRSFLMIPLTAESLGYALAEDKCDADSYYTFDAADMKQAQAEGIIDPSLPVTPDISLGWKAMTYGWYAFAAFVVLAVIWSKIAGFRAPRPSRAAGQRGHTPAPSAGLGLSPRASDMILHAMCKVAKADGYADQSEVDTIRGVYQQLTGETLSVPRIMAQLDTISGQEPFESVNSMAEGLSPAECQIMMQASLMVAVADGHIQKEEHGLVTQLARALRISGDEFRGMLAQIAPRPA